MEPVDERDDAGEARLSYSDDAAELEENSLLVLLDDACGRCQ
jgi:hypothetical protein